MSKKEQNDQQETKEKIEKEEIIENKDENLEESNSTKNDETQVETDSTEEENEESEEERLQEEVRSLKEDKIRVLAEMEKYHPKDNRSWYLAVLAVDPAFQRRGLGSIMMKHVNRILDEKGFQGFLETSNSKNISLETKDKIEKIIKKS